MRIARIVESYPSSSEEINRGLMPNVHYLSKLQCEMGHHVTVFAIRQPGQPSRENRDGVDVIRVKPPRLRRTFLGLKISKTIVQLGERPDIVHAMNPMPLGWLHGQARSILDSRYALSVHGTIEPLNSIGGIPSLEKLYIHEFRKLTASLARAVELVLPVSHFVGRELESLGIDGDRIRVVPSGVNTDIFVPRARPQNDLTRILYVGRFSRGKGLSNLIKAAELIPDRARFRVLLVGGIPSDNAYAEVLTEIRRSGAADRIGVQPPIPHSDLPRVYGDHDLFVLPSESEALGKVLLEAMACGIPVVATDSGGVRDVVSHGRTGFLVPTRDPRALAHAIEELISDPSRRIRMGSRARRKALAFDWRIVARLYIEAFKSAL